MVGVLSAEKTPTFFLNFPPIFSSSAQIPINPPTQT